MSDRFEHVTQDPPASPRSTQSPAETLSAWPHTEHDRGTQGHPAHLDAIADDRMTRFIRHREYHDRLFWENEVERASWTPSLSPGHALLRQSLVPECCRARNSVGASMSARARHTVIRNPSANADATHGRAMLELFPEGVPEVLEHCPYSQPDLTESHEVIRNHLELGAHIHDSTIDIIIAKYMALSDGFRHIPEYAQKDKESRIALARLKEYYQRRR